MILIITVTGMVYNGRGYHAYMNIWTPVEDEMLRLIPEPTTVEPPRKGRFGEMAYVPCREVVPISEVCIFFRCITLIHVCFQYRNELFTVGVSNDNCQL